MFRLLVSYHEAVFRLLWISISMGLNVQRGQSLDLHCGVLIEVLVKVEYSSSFAAEILQVLIVYQGDG